MLKKEQIKESIICGVNGHDIGQIDDRSNFERKRFIDKLTNIVYNNIYDRIDILLYIYLIDVEYDIKIEFSNLDGLLHIVDDINSTLFFESVKYMDSIEILHECIPRNLK